MPADDTAWTREALRLYRRYQLEIVEACGLCPWAEHARVGGHVTERVLLADDPLPGALAAIVELAPQKSIEIALLIFPKLAVTRQAFEKWVAKLQAADKTHHPLGEIPFMFAAFHPDADADTSSPERLIPFLRRTPDPTIQLVRASAIDKARVNVKQGTQFFDPSQLDFPPMHEAAPPLREKIAITNLATVKTMGLEAMRERLDDIAKDRRAVYEELSR